MNAPPAKHNQEHENRERVRLRQTPSGIEQRLLARARQRGLQAGNTLIVGFSGGRDSLVLAAAMRRMAQVLQIWPVLVHVDHRLRAESSHDALRASDLADCLGLEAVTRQLPRHPADVHRGVGIEEAARRERYRVLFEEARVRNALAVVTAHHQADQAETVLLHLLRGGGVHGASGMSEWSTSVELVNETESDISPEGNRKRIGLWRPFLSESRAAIDRELQELGLEAIEDPSNSELVLRRNALRHKVLPLLETHFPGAMVSLSRYAELAADDDSALQELVNSIYVAAVDPGGQFLVRNLRHHPVAIRRRLLREWLQRSTGILTLSAERTAAMLALADSAESGKFVEVGEGWRVRRVPDALVFEHVHSERRERDHEHQQELGAP